MARYANKVMFIHSAVRHCVQGPCVCKVRRVLVFNFDNRPAARLACMHISHRVLVYKSMTLAFTYPYMSCLLYYHYFESITENHITKYIPIIHLYNYILAKLGETKDRIVFVFMTIYLISIYIFILRFCCIVSLFLILHAALRNVRVND